MGSQYNGENKQANKTGGGGQKAPSRSGPKGSLRMHNAKKPGLPGPATRRSVPSFGRVVKQHPQSEGLKA